jgi:predicted transport protein
MKGQNLDIAQWLAYLSLLLNNKAEFVQKLSILKNKVIRNEDIDWTQSRVIFVSENFTEHQKESINFKDLPISLYEMRQLISWEIIFNEIKAKNKTESIKTITKWVEKFSQVEKEILTFDEAYHFEWKTQKIVELYEKIKAYLIELDPNFEVVYRKMYIAFRLNKRNITSMHLFVNSINIWLYGEYGTIRDEYGLIRDVSNTGNYWSAENEVKIDSDENLLRVLDLVQQAYNNRIN